MFTLEGIRSFHSWTHESLDVLIGHLHTVPPGMLNSEMPGFAQPTVRHQLIHVLSVESAWTCDLRNVPTVGVPAEENTTLAAIIESKARVRAATLDYVNSLSTLALNTAVTNVPDGWVGPHRSPAFILLHVLTHAFHHKGQIVAMLRLLGRPAPDTDLQRAD